MSHWIHFKYNPEKGRYERREPSRWRHLYVVVSHLFSGTIIGAIILYSFIFFVGSPSQWRLEKENELLKRQYEMLDSRLDNALDVLEAVGMRDDNLYRVVLQGEPLGEPSRKALQLYEQRYDSLMHLSDADLVVRVSQKMDAVERELYLQSKSFDEVVNLCRSQEERLRHIPSIQPIPNKDLKRMASGFGWRIDPIYHVRKHHDGMDFSAEQGTDVFVTGDGRVLKSGFEKGYGLSVVVDHGYGYTTRYAHLSRKLVGVGQRLKRGQKIGEVGNTGKSTAPHLHYEVHLNGRVMNPANYYFMDLTPAQYEEMIAQSDNVGQVMD